MGFRLEKSAAWLAVPLVLWPAAAGAAEDLQARGWAASCAACHGTEGRAVGAMPVLAGRPKQELYGALKAFKDGSRPATVMHQHAKGYSDEQLKRIAEYFAKQKP
ncbi:c-type cytochrome [Pelomicrobium methylotrophicum]|uniref:C-type cytochrome n=1 Tax=Pelomicrobium methylotrophicum TaxID=2602750 RepID=A0A5C7EJ31_9PROT|nr:c-type cytochrome [Pelomicrobium methylotrophicum]TXF11428.1 c-type cytochrome [Pelomicrobium methylotrophicum]